MRTIAEASSNRNSASALVSSVLPTPVGQEQERAEGAIGVLKAGAGAANRGGHGLDGIFLADDPRSITASMLSSFRARPPSSAQRNTRPAADDAGDVLVGHFLAQHGAFGRHLRRRELLFEIRDAAILEFTGPREVAGPLRLLKLEARLVALFLELGLGRDFFFLGLPALGQLRGLLLKVGKLLLEFLQPVLRRAVLLLLQRLALDLELDDPAIEILDFLGLDSASMRIRLAASSEVDRLVGKEAVGDVTVAERRRGSDRRVVIRTPW